MDAENVIVNGVELSQPAKLCEVFRSYFSSTFRNNEGNDPQLNYSAISRMQHFTISAEDVHRQLINLNPKKSEGADEMHQKIHTSLARNLAAPLANFFNYSLETVDRLNTVCVKAIKGKQCRYIISVVYLDFDDKATGVLTEGSMWLNYF